MLILGVVGGIASGKSLVTQQFLKLGAERLDGDRAGHEVLREAQVKQWIQQQFGDDVFDHNQEIDRQALAKIVFAPTPAGQQALSNLEQMTHPRIGERLDQQIEAARQAGKPAAVLDAAVMHKAGWQRRCDKMIFVHAPREQRLTRALQRGWSEAEFDRREAAQLPLEQKRSAADCIIDNSRSIDETQCQTREFWNSLGLPAGQT